MFVPSDSPSAPSIDDFGLRLRMAIEQPMTVSAYSQRDIPLVIDVRIGFALAPPGGDIERFRAELDRSMDLSRQVERPHR